ncbi:hypothetical protein CN275_05250 [Bacillus anthracis]|nr:hypothetical protein CN275_05250 [Bacillus anthracis]
MELLYIWIENYGVIQKQGFNFGGKYIFEYSNQTEILSFNKNANYISDLFNTSNHSKSNIINVTAIIGENGAGKSTILDLIRNNIIKTKRENNKIFIICMESPNQIVCYGSGINIKNQSQLIDKENFRFEDTYPLNDEPFKLRGLTYYPKKYGIYYSNIFDNKEELYDFSEYNLSTNFLIKYDKLDLESNLINAVTIHRFSEVRRQIIFAKEFSKFFNNEFEIPFEIPNKISISPIAFTISNIRLHKYKLFINKVNEELDRYHKLCQGDFTNGTTNEAEKNKLRKELLKCKFYKTIFNIFFYDICKLPSPDNVYDKQLRLSDLKGKTILNKLDYLFNEINTLNKVNAIFPHYNLLKVLNKHIDTIEVGDELFSTSIVLDINSPILNELLVAYMQTLKENQYLTFNWRSLSSGETALLNLFSRFYSTRSSYELQKETGWSFNDTILLLIDEAELFLHPQWQKELLFNLFKFLQSIYKNYKLQIIITSNSPFIVSELPHSNIIFIKKEGNKSVVIDQLPETKLTFASNIHTLLSNTFFMKDGLIGAFAKYKINKLLNLIINSSTEELEKRHSEIKKEIGIIGEPLVRNKLYSLLQEKVPTHITNFNNELQLLKNKVNELERKLKKHDSN